MMTIAEFQALNAVELEEVVWDHGTFITDFDEGNDLCDIYAVFDFYVAFSYKANVNKKMKVTAHIYADQLANFDDSN